MKAISVESHGGPEVLQLKDVEAPTPAEGEVLIDVLVAGINYIDTYFREGIYPSDLPFTPGKEGVGRVAYDPEGIIAEGTKVAWADSFGSYAEQVCVARDRLVAVPQEIDDETAASMLLQGMTAHMLVHSVYDLVENSTCLVTAGAGGVGLLVTQMAADRGATVISVVSSDAKEERAYAAGATHVLRYGDDLVEQVRELTAGQGVDVVYDGVGQATFDQSLHSVKPRGLVVLFGAASGPVDPLDPQVLNQRGSIYLTRPSLGAYVADGDEFTMRAQAVVQAIVEKRLDVTVSASYPLAEAERAHRDLQERATVGSIVLRMAEG
ncbi:quinone oxidoreductase family protein [Corynebacterium tapiri]|uniref:Quinone oxidoreductase n=1 Tax=Corynebacterium tapiri TaxID=1448266 RepID=A0A5C4U4U3_9CORY|nr:quinone oxidoreductase [Corynebacterium tapiri]TNL97572.1 quinone oxidoreductase [Corynebacterium tapiri]